MRDLLVLLDGSLESWQTAYTAYGIAANTGSKLIGLAILDPRSQANAEQILEEFEVGARAAGVNARGSIQPATLSTPILTDLSEIEGIEGIFVARSRLKGEADLKGLLDLSGCPLWIIPSERNIRRILAVYDHSAAAPDTLNLALALVRCFELELNLVLTAEDIEVERALPKDIPINLSYQRIDSSLAESLGSMIDSKDIDLAIISQSDEISPLWELCQQIGCLLAVCPALNSL